MKNQPPMSPHTHPGKRAAVVTGAGRGIGKAIALLLAEQGYDVAVNYRHCEGAARDTCAAVERAGAAALLVQADVADPPQADHMIDAVMDRFGRIDVLVNNAGITRNDTLLRMLPEDIESVIRTNLLGTIYPTQAAALHMIGQRYGRIVNISSSAAGKPGPGQAAYAASKGGIESFTRAMAVELAPKNILVNCVAPGVTVTDMSIPMREHRDDEVMQRLLLKRYAEPREMAEAVAFLAGPANLYITGEVLHLNGGMKMA